MANKQNPQALDVNATISKTEAFVKKNQKAIIAAVVAIVVVVGGCFGCYYWQQNRNEKGQVQLGMGVELFLQGIQTNDSTAVTKAIKGDGEFKGFEQIAKDYSFTSSANLAHAYAGECYAFLGKYKEAIEHLESFDPQSDAIASPLVVSCLASCYEQTKDFDKAVDAYKDAAKLGKNDCVAPVCLVKAATILKNQKKFDEAKKLYEQVKNDYPTSSYSMPQQAGMATFNSAEIDGLIEEVSK